jgi:hypothetical protein
MLVIENTTKETKKNFKRKEELAIKAKKMREWRRKNKKHCFEYRKQYRLKNIKKIKLQEKKSRNRNKEKRKITYKKWAEKNKKHILKYAKNYRIKNNKEINRKKRIYTKLYEQRLEVKIVKRLRVRVRNALRNTKKSNNVLKLTGITVLELKKYLESKFTKKMNWEKFKKGLIHIDHIRPCASFDLTDPKQQAMCFNYTNLQPLWAVDNLKKGAKHETINA